MPTITLTVPEHTGLNEKQFAQYVAAKLYEDGKLTLGQAADLVGMGKADFMEILGNFGVSIINYPAEEILRDANAISNSHS
jgi:predicted HTH domain antitoxin